ncbi:PP2C family protein-serine/threonine phosphatase [Nocardioides terrisoli]|uniref:PP2C family protein-serine/threonine phosphatase n=1 Tax=Nocardioides terrisoli TaxID=3388267 RepID=UPI00287B6C77|nr:protein phosphatase 2C domain-containing protein [Nocardioides marmorisolisilvae]
MLRLSGTGVTHSGLVRPHNEDAAFYSPDLLLVADGVGGGAAGEVASATTTYVVSATAMARREEDPTLVLTDAVSRAQEQVRAGVLSDPDREGMATTLTAVLTNGERFALAHLGDSRGYVHRDGELIRITRDHTLVAQLVDEGRLDEQDVPEHPWRNVVTRSVNGDPDRHADVLPLALRVDDRVLLASDGLTDLVDEDQIATVLERHGDDDAVEVLLDAALAAGGRDNVTIVLATVIVGPRVSADGHLLGAVLDPDNVVDAAAVRGARTA